MNPFCKLILATAAALLSTAPLTAQTVRVGTFDKSSITVAFYRSPMWADVLKQKQTELEAAKKSNDQQKIAELERWGISSQESAHKQLMGEACITNIQEALRPAFAEISAKAQVAIIVPGFLYSDNTVQTVDLTDQLLDWLKADAQTRKIIEGMRKLQKPSATMGGC